MPDERSLNQFSDIIETAFSALKLLDIPDLASFIITYLSMSKLDKETIKDFEHAHKSEKIPTFEMLSEHVKIHAKIAGRSNTLPAKSPAYCHVSNRFECKLCRSPHKIFHCAKFKSLAIPERTEFAKKERLCLNCLQSHAKGSCFSKKRCFKCGQEHNTLLCENKQTASNALCGVYEQNVQLIPKLLVHVNSIKRSAIAILDSGANINLISQAYCIKHGLRMEQASRKVTGLGLISVQIIGSVRLTIISRINNNIAFCIEASVVKNITTRLPNVSLCAKAISEFKNLALADPKFHKAANIDMILGSSMFAQIITGQKTYAKSSKLIAINTKLGYVVMGQTEGNQTCMQVLISKSEDEKIIHRSVQSLWELDSVPTKKHLSQDELACEKHFVDNVNRDKTGFYTVALPFKVTPDQLGDSYGAAKRRLHSLEKRLDSDPKLREGYNSTLEEYLSKGFLSKIEVGTDNGPAYYIPHSAVYKPEKDTSKIRIVLDASSSSTSGKSLNDLLYSGPNLQSHIFNLLINFRLFKTAICADIEKMFLSIRVTPKHRRFLRILYRFRKEDPVSVYEFERVPFGLTSSPYLARRVMNQLFCDQDSPWLKGTLASSTFSYMDDYLISVQTPEEAAVLRTQLVDTLASAGFNLTKWVSNSREFIKDVPISARAQSSINIDQNSELKLVGLWWDPIVDNLFFKTKDIDVHAHCTKRHLLSVTAALYDPLGFLTPLTAGMKLLIQECWKRDLDWDTIVPIDIAAAWRKIENELKYISTPTVPRHLGVSKNSKLTLLGFADASEKCYGAVIYVRTGDYESSADAVTLLCAKSRIAPLKKVSLARLELCAAHLLALMIQTVTYEIGERKEIDQVVACSDSEITLAWIRSSPHKWHTFIANRTAAIQDIVPPENWYHIAGKLNPSDVISRPVSPSDLLKQTEWFTGPSWARRAQSQWPCTPVKTVMVPRVVPESKEVVLFHNLGTEIHPLDDLAERTSSWTKLLNIVVYILRFSRRIKSTGSITVSDQETAEKYVIIHVRNTHFKEVLDDLNRNKQCAKVYSKLNPFIKDGIIRVGGRLANAPLSYEQRHPVLLPSRNRFAKLLVEHYHKLNYHTGPHLLLALLRHRYWILAARSLVRKTVNSCVTCFKTNPRSGNQLMGDLPECRMQGVKAFDRVGVDYAGPLPITMGTGRNVKKRKAYICLFICLATKALHLELVSDLTAELFLAAFKRFLSRRGPVTLILSDGGTNFVGASRKLGEIYSFLESSDFNTEILKELTPRKIEFKRNPPAGPNFGGLWESNIKNVKNHLYRVMGSQILTYEELNTLLTQIEAILNSRPLCVLSSDPNDPIALTPAHFLCTEPLNFLPAHNLTEVNVSRVRRQALIDKLLQSYWKRWRLEYLTTLQSRDKWTNITTPITVGRVVIIKEPNAPPLCWPLGVVVETFPGKDGLIRVVKVKTRSGYYTRPISKICPLPTA